MTRPDPAPDIEVASFLEGLPRHLTYREMAARVRYLFGPDRAWSLERVRGYFGASGTVEHYGRRSLMARNPELMTFVRDRASRLMLDELLDACREAFPGRPLPSRSALHRFIQRDRLEDSAASAELRSKAR